MTAKRIQCNFTREIATAEPKRRCDPLEKIPKCENLPVTHPTNRSGVATGEAMAPAEGHGDRSPPPGPSGVLRPGKLTHAGIFSKGSNVVPRVQNMARGAKRRLGTGKVPNGTLTEGRFREIVEDTQQAIADDLGVVQQTVSRAIDELPESVKRTQLSKVNTDEKREQKRDVTPPARPDYLTKQSPHSVRRLFGKTRRRVTTGGNPTPSGGSGVVCGCH